MTLARPLPALAILIWLAVVPAVHGQPETTDSLTVDAAVEQVLDTHPAIDAARTEVDAAAARIGQARSALWPRIDAVGTYRRQDPVPEITVPGEQRGAGGGGGAQQRTIRIQPNNLYDGRLQVQQTLYDFGQTSAQIDRAHAGRTTARRRVETERSVLALETVRAFYSALLAQAQIRVQQKQIKQLERTLEVVRHRKAVGTATTFEIQSTQARLSAARSERTRFRSRFQSQKSELRHLLGHDPDTSLVVTGTLGPNVVDTAEIEADTLTEQALRRHPSVQVARAQVQAAHRRVEAADHTDAPHLALTAQGGFKNGYPGALNEPRLNESVGVTLRVPLFEGFATRHRVEEAAAQAQAAEARLADVRRQVSTRVEQAAVELRASLDQLETANVRVEQAETAARLARTRQDAGTLTNLDLLDAETQLREARLDRIVVRYEVVMGWYALYHAAGTLLPFEPPR